MQLKMTLFRYIFIFYPLFGLLSQSVDQIGFLTVRTDDSTYVFLNDHLLTRGYFDSLAVKPGDYLIHSYDTDNPSWEYRGRSKEITVQAGMHEIIDFTAQKSVKIMTIPPAGEVYFNNQFLGFTPLYFFPNGKNHDTSEVKILRQGYREEKFRLNSASDVYTINLIPGDAFPERKVYRAGLENEGFRWSREGFVIVSLVTSWTAFFLKREADKNYDKYNRSSDPRKMDKYYNRTNTLDTYAEISFGISIASLGTYFYYLFSE